MLRVIRRILVLFFLGGFTVVSALLPPLPQVDKYLMHADHLYAAEDYAGAFKVMEKVIKLKKERPFTLSDKFHFKYARVALSADSIKIAFESVNKYLLATGKEGQFYKEALALLREAEKAEETVISAEKTGNETPTDSEDVFYNEIIKTEGACEGLSEGSSCWMALINHPKCYVWNDYFKEDEITTWSGKCSDGFAQGEGTFIVSSLYNYGVYTTKGKGHFQNGKRQGQWVERPWEGAIWESSYVDGKRHGPWVMRSSYGVEEGTYVDGQKQGHWVWREKDGTVVYEGSYVDGQKQGHWVIGFGEHGHLGPIIVHHEGSYVDGQKQGHWVMREKNGIVSEVFYVDGRKHGQETIRFPDGFVGGGSYVDGKKHGYWVEVNRMGAIVTSKFKGRYVNGKREGIWLMYRHGGCWSIPWKKNKNGVSAPSYHVKEKKERCREAGLIP